jgi:SOUL heme-binding protein
MTTYKHMIPGIALAAVSLFTGCAAIDAVANLEEPAFTVIKKDGNFEVREYRAMIVAETIVVARSLDDASGYGFRAIAGYIFGANTAKTGSSGVGERIAMTAPVTMTPEKVQNEKIAMTAPVTTEALPEKAKDGSERWRMHFVMPRKYTLDTLPTPKNPAVTLREIAPKRVAVHRFSGFSGEAKVAEKTAELTKWLSDNQFKPSAPAQLARYNPPLTPPPFRRNEILMAVE